MRDVAGKRSNSRMGAKALPGLDLGRIFEEGFRSRTDPSDDWHREDPEDWKHHASSLIGCERQSLLKRLGHDTDGITLQSALTFEVGHSYHRLLENFAQRYEEVEPRFKVLAVEAGGTHPRLPLKARCDLLFTWDGEPILADLKTEAPMSASRRRDEQKKFGYPYPYRYEHVIQIAAQALVIEQIWKGAFAINQGRVLYLNKVNMDVDQVPCTIDDEMRLKVMRLIQRHEENFRRYQETGVAPGKLTAADDAWRCRPRSDADPRGLYCSCRSKCYS